MPAQTVYFCPTFLVAPRISNDAEWRKLEARLKRDWPSIIERDVVIVGLGHGWRGTERRGGLTVHAPLRLRRSLPLNTLLVYAVHFAYLLGVILRRRAVVLAGTPEAAFATALVSRVLPRRVRLALRVEGPASGKSTPGSAAHRIKRFVERTAIRTARLVIPMGSFTGTFARASGANPENIELLPFPLAIGPVEVTPLHPDPVVLFAGRLEREKGVTHLVNAFAKVRASIPEARLVVAGAGPLLETLQSSALALGLRHAVDFKGWVSAREMTQLYEQCYLLCLPSIWEEGLGMVVVEAGASGRPVVASALGGILDVLEHGVTGLAVAPGDEDALAEALVQLLQDTDRAIRMGLAGRERALAYLAGYEPALARVQHRLAGLSA